MIWRNSFSERVNFCNFHSVDYQFDNYGQLLIIQSSQDYLSKWQFFTSSKKNSEGKILRNFSVEKRKIIKTFVKLCNVFKHKRNYYTFDFTKKKFKNFSVSTLCGITVSKLRKFSRFFANNFVKLMFLLLRNY